MRKTLLAIVCVAALGTMFVAEAGPPLICHPYNIGGAKSLPWGAGTDWDNPNSSYNTKNLTTDTLAILDSAPSVLVRMETLRRASLYGARDHEAAHALLAQLKAREAAAEQSAKPSPEAYFDYGYLLATIKQAEFKYKADITGGIDGYTFVEKALAINPDSSEMHFAAAVMASWPSRPAEREEHLRKARAARNDALLAQNLTTMFQ